MPPSAGQVPQVGIAGKSTAVTQKANSNLSLPQDSLPLQFGLCEFHTPPLTDTLLNIIQAKPSPFIASFTRSSSPHLTQEQPPIAPFHELRPQPVPLPVRPTRVKS